MSGLWQWLPNLSPLVAIVAIVGTVVAGWRVRRFRELMKRLEQFPEKDRRRAIEIEIGRAVPPKLTGEQWLKNENHRRILILSSLAVLLIAGLVGMVLFNFGGSRYLPPSISYIFSSANTTSTLAPYGPLTGKWKGIVNCGDGYQNITQIEFNDNGTTRFYFQSGYSATYKYSYKNDHEINVVFDPNTGAGHVVGFSISGTRLTLTGFVSAPCPFRKAD